MRIVFTEEPPVLHKKDIREGYLEHQNGIMVFKSGDFKQNLSPKDVELLKVAAGIVEKPEEKETPKENKFPKGSFVPGTKVSWDGRNGLTTGDILELIENGKKARVKSDVDEKVYKVSLKNLKLS